MRSLVLGLLAFGLAACKIVEAGGIGGNQTTITGDGNTVASATKPSTMAAGPGAPAQVKKSNGVAVGDGSQVASSRKGLAVLGQGNTVAPPAAPSTWWKWLLVGTALGYLGPKLFKLGSRFI
ncbi:hypothetical protein [Hymenobacter cellulosivorans]|uniref:Uncharacterized protein n=1 Tax=Hymenobacter cellulosivorans TaxID=2932249 RepID=A0ABY4F6R8_9BACT|nr:hypothetical protein [Hymenobacter cellulosivorans]UOQ51723.1 hypothetical protein MUN80_18400 [Hymenobacter cellulosivorans]